MQLLWFIGLCSTHNRVIESILVIHEKEGRRVCLHSAPPGNAELQLGMNGSQRKSKSNHNRQQSHAQLWSEPLPMQRSGIGRACSGSGIHTPHTKSGNMPAQGRIDAGVSFKCDRGSVCGDLRVRVCAGASVVMLVLLHLLVHTNRVTGLPRCRERDAICVYEYVHE
jgi:hypothetical protein